MPHAPAKEQAVFTVSPRNALPHDGPLRTAAGMNAERRVVFTHTAPDLHIVRLLETDAVAIVIPHDTILDHCAEAAIQENATTPTAVQVDVLALVAVDDEIFDACAFEVVTADHGKDGCGFCLILRHAIGVKRGVDGESVSVPTGDARHGRVEAAGAGIPNRYTVSDLKSIRIDYSHLFLAVIAIER